MSLRFITYIAILRSAAESKDLRFAYAGNIVDRSEYAGEKDYCGEPAFASKRASRCWIELRSKT
jgi:hypothetical protein